MSLSKEQFHLTNVKKNHYSEKDTPMECNSLIYTYSNAQYNLYKVLSCEENSFVCNPIKYKKCTFPETPTLNWSLVGVFIHDKVVECENKIIMRSAVKGKVIAVQKYLITCPENILRET